MAKAKRNFKRILFASDFHCGHRVGLTPPGRNSNIYCAGRWHDIRAEIWDFFESTVASLGTIDALVLNGDLIDGKGKQRGEHLTVDRKEQCDIAEECIRTVKAKEIVISYGTGFHVGDEEDWEDVIARNVGASKIGGHEWYRCNGTVFDVKHHPSGGSQVPHARHTAVARDHLWNQLHAERGLQPKADVFIRSHVHYFNYCGGPDWLAMTMPALQGAGSKYGGRRCSGIVDIGMVHFDCYEDGSYTWQVHLAQPEAQAAQIFDLCG